MYEEYPPLPSLISYIKCYWRMEIDIIPDTRRRLLIENCEFTINLGSPVEYIRNDGIVQTMINTGITGPMAHPMGMRSNDKINLFGICFRPGGAYPFFKTPAHQLVDQYFDTEDILNQEGNKLAEHIQKNYLTTESQIKSVDKYLLNILETSHQDNTIVNSAVKAIEQSKGRITIDQLSHYLGVSHRHLNRQFKEQIGLTPKQFCKNLRFKNAYKNISTSVHVDFADIAMNCGYYDQAHFINEFRNFAGTSPTKYLKTTTIPDFITVNF